MTKTNEQYVTNNLLQFCYTCEHAHECTTEEQCKACWAENGMLPEENEGLNETRKYLNMAYE
ncbi:hypothetical protein Q5741_00395 [Paenibacillus sp. JX-17]|uniref:YhfH family protein n=1 Tax=Paenibacillus lacisoli TaxID=3064525 RepID=A0ABT9C6H9_9BACL|nr:hypothetical protein [Paenibacillus sp. JX-17]MDO7904866.1 hypothetical protein [Paenibacillus sp. JX-17]